MKTQDSKEWIWPPTEQLWAVWGMVPMGGIAILTSHLLSFFSGLAGAPWIWCYGIAVVAGAVGTALMFYAKLPLYRQRRFFTFGTRALPEQRRPFYRWAYRCAILSAPLLGCLLLSRV